MWKSNAEYETHKTCSEKVDFENKKEGEDVAEKQRAMAVALKFG